MSGVPGRDAEVRGGVGRQLAEPARSAGRAAAARLARTARPATSSRAGPTQRAALEVERQVADLARGRVDPLAGQPRRQPRRQDAVAADALPDRGLVALDPVRLGVGLEPGDGLADAGQRGTRDPTAPPIGGRPSVRRWSSQTIAGRSGVPSSSATTSVTRWVVSATPPTLDGSGRGLPPPPSEAHSRRQASPIAAHQTSGSCSAQPGCGETYGSIGTRPMATRLPVRVEQDRADALRPDVDRQRVVRQGADPSLDRPSAGPVAARRRLRRVMRVARALHAHPRITSGSRRDRVGAIATTMQRPSDPAQGTRNLTDTPRSGVIAASSYH